MDQEPGSKDSFEEQLERLVEEFTGRIRSGEDPSVEEYAQRHPALADRIRGILPAVLSVEMARRAGEPPAHGPQRPAPGASAPRLGDFTVLREVGRGGMGIVYEAEQLSLGRRVALKVLPFHLLQDPKRLDRFHREARAAATLQHPHIVSVYGVGEEGGDHYYVMQFIEGESLDRLIAELRRFHREEASWDEFASARPQLAGLLAAVGAGDTFFSGIARLVADVADALSYAHGQGVLHRDVKPSNLLLDREGKVWLTDFGLAKTEGSEDLTRSGEVVGTLPYMAPERFKGWADPRSDIYSLGLVLYELLTLQPAFEDADRSRLMRRILEDEPPRPRKVEARIPRDLETIILKAISKEPGHRYSDAAALGEDLRRFMNHESIHARQSSALRRCAKWARRRPAAAALVAVSLLAAFLLLAGSFWYSARLRQESLRTRANLEKALEATDRMLTWVGDEGLSAVPRMEPIRRGLLMEALKFHEGFLKGGERDPVVRLGAARAYARVGQIYALLGQRADGRDAYRRAIALLEELSRDDPASELYGRELAATRSLASLHESAALPARGAEVSKFLVPAAKNVVDIAPVDLDGDGRMDLVVASRGSSRISVLRGEGSRSFVPGGTFPTGQGPYQLLACDMDGDKIQDILSLDQASKSIEILFGTGKGSFEPPLTNQLEFQPWSMVALDADRDGFPEVAAVGGTRELAVIRRTSGREFTVETSSMLADYPTFLAAGDLDGDGSTDLAVGCSAQRNALLSLVWNDGKGRFSVAPPFAPGASPSYISCGDVDRDGDLDLVVTDNVNLGVSVLLNEGARSFRHGAKFAFGSLSMVVGLADLTGDANADLVVSNEADGMVSILLGDGKGTFPDVVRFQTGGYAFRGAIADIDGDRRLDIAVANGDTNDVAILFHLQDILSSPGRKGATVTEVREGTQGREEKQGEPEAEGQGTGEEEAGSVK